MCIRDSHKGIDGLCGEVIRHTGSCVSEQSCHIFPQVANPSSVPPFSRGKNRDSDDGIPDGIRRRTDKGLSLIHILLKVIAESLKLSQYYDVSRMMVYVIASYHGEVQHYQFKI